MNNHFKNPTKTKSWEDLNTHSKYLKSLHLYDMFKDNPNRISEMSIEWDDFFIDFSKNRWNAETINIFKGLADELDLKSQIQSYFIDNTINFTENRAVLHTALRSNVKEVYKGNVNVIEQIKAVKSRIKLFSEEVISGAFKGATGKSITDIISVGIGGSDLGPQLVCDALSYYKNHLNIHFLSNIDGDHVQEKIQELNPETTLVIVVSKSFKTSETIKNAVTLKQWYKNSELSISKHFVAVSANIVEVENFGITKDNIFPMWDWVGGRFSLWSAVGLSIALSIGYDNFESLLKGAQKADDHFLNTKIDKNIPVLMGFLSVLYNNFYHTQQEAVIPYSHYLQTLVSYLQQGFMESNGKYVDRNGQIVDYQTGNVVFGDVGCNAQHAFMQLFHQGTKTIPVDFIGFCQPLHGNKEHHDILMANLFAQSKALAFGTKSDAVQNPYKVFEGNKPSTTLLISKLTPENLGKLLAIYEHKIVVQGIIWNINSFDQFGVELGKTLSREIISNMENKNSLNSPLINFYNKHNF